MRLKLQGPLDTEVCVLHCRKKENSRGEQVAEGIEEIVLAMRMNAGARKRNERRQTERRQNGLPHGPSPPTG